jgi:hypothetical protein
VKAVALGADDVRLVAQKELAFWLRAYQSAPYAPPPPTALQLATCREAFEAASAALEPSLRRSIEQVILANCPVTGAAQQH